MKKKKKKKKKNINTFKLDINLSNHFWIPDQLQEESHSPITNTWFQSSHYSCSQDNKFLVNDIKDKNKNKDITRCNKIEIFPTKKQKKILIIWSDIYRYYYNQTVKYFRSNKLTNFYKIRKIIKDRVNKNTSFMKKKKKYNVPSHTIDNAIHDVTKAYTSAFANLKNGNIRYFKLRYKKNKSPRQTIALESSCFSITKEKNREREKYKKSEDQLEDYEQYVKYLYGFNINDVININTNKLKNTFCNSIFGEHINSDGDLKNIEKDCRLVYHKNRNKFFLFSPYIKITKESANNEDICSLDPGKRTFQTCYTSKEVINIGYDCDKRLAKEYKRLDYYNKKRKEESKPWWNRKYHQIENKIDNLIDELHYKTCNYLCSRYKYIMIGKLSTKNTNRRNKSCLNKLSKRILSRLGHYKFRKRLESKCEELGVKYYEVDESYTSKTCGKCGYINKKLKGEKIYECPRCKLKIDRDYNGARNILIKNYEKLDNKTRVATILRNIRRLKKAT